MDQDSKERGVCIRSQRGVALGMVVLVAVCFSIAVFTALVLALSRAKQKDFYKRRARAQYVAEAGLVWAMEQLWVDQTYCGIPPLPTMNGLTATITVTNCSGTNHTVSSTVNGF